MSCLFLCRMIVAWIAREVGGINSGMTNGLINSSAPSKLATLMTADAVHERAPSPCFEGANLMIGTLHVTFAPSLT